MDPHEGMLGLPPVRTIWGVARSGYEDLNVDSVVDRLVEDTVDAFGGETIEELRSWEAKKDKHFGLYD